MNAALDFVADNSMWFAFVFGYLLLNIMKRIPEPQNKVLKFLWKLVEYACFLTWDRWGGALKLPFTVSAVARPSDEPSQQ